MMSIMITGTGFTADSELKIGDGKVISVLNQGVSSDGKTLFVNIDIPKVDPGEYDVTVTNTFDGKPESVTKSKGFVIKAHSPVIQWIKPDTVIGGAEVPVTIHGQHLKLVTTIQFSDASNNPILVKPESITDDTISLKHTFSDTDVELTYDVTVTTNDTQSNTIEDSFTVVPKLTISGVEPHEVVAGS